MDIALPFPLPLIAFYPDQKRDTHRASLKKRCLQPEIIHNTDQQRFTFIRLHWTGNERAARVYDPEVIQGRPKSKRRNTSHAVSG